MKKEKIKMINIIGRFIAALLLMGVGVWGATIFKDACKDLWNPKRPNGETTIQINAEPILEAKIDLQKILILTNKGLIPINDIKIFATKYILDEQSFNNKQIKIANRQKIGGAIKKIETLKERDESIQIDLKENPVLHFFENPGGKDNVPLLTYYCFRISYLNSINGKVNILYKTTPSYKNFPSFIEDQESTATTGIWGDFMLDILKQIKDDQIEIFNDNL